MTEAVTAAMVCAALKLRFEPASHALLFEVASGTGANSRRFADALAFGLWPSHGHKVEGIEVKVSRSDFAAEMKSPQKSDAVMRYCHHWWLACPKGMVKPDELPPTWGLLELANGKLTARVKAPLLTPEQMPPTFIASLLRRHAGADEEMTRIAVRREVDARVKVEKEAFERRTLDRYNSDIVRAQRALEGWEAVKEKTGIDLREYGEADEFIEAVRVVRALGGKFSSPIRELRRSAGMVIDALAPFQLQASDDSP